MPHPLQIVLASSMILLAAPAPADACSIATDWASPPPVEHEFDADKAPAPPKILDAFISHHYADDPGCGGYSSCGDIHGLNLSVQVAPNAQDALLRITHEDGSTVFASSWADSDGTMNLFLPGYNDADGDITLVFALIDAEGYPSIDVTDVAFHEGRDDEAGCRIGGQGITGSGMLLMLLTGLGLVHWRRRRQV